MPSYGHNDRSIQGETELQRQGAGQCQPLLGRRPTALFPCAAKGGSNRLWVDAPRFASSGPCEPVRLLPQQHLLRGLRSNTATAQGGPTTKIATGVTEMPKHAQPGMQHCVAYGAATRIVHKLGLVAPKPVLGPAMLQASFLI